MASPLVSSAPHPLAVGKDLCGVNSEPVNLGQWDLRWLPAGERSPAVIPGLAKFPQGAASQPIREQALSIPSPARF